jgi:putative membrane protein
MTFYLVPQITLGTGIILATYLYAISPWNPDRPAPVAPWRIGLFTFGMAIFFAAFHPPVDTLSSSYFSIHMTQHILVTLIGPPLLILGIPEWMLNPLMRTRLIYAIVRWFTKPVVAGLIGASVFWGWHLPTLYEATLRDRITHDTAHLTIILAAIVMWWPVVSRTRAAPAASTPVQMFYLFMLTLPMGLLSSIFVFASDPIYPAYALASNPFGISTVADQRIGGLIMKLGGTAVLWGVISVKFFRWAGTTPDKHALLHSASH